MRQLITGCLLLCVVLGVRGQHGTYYLSHHSPSEEKFDNVCFDMVQDQQGILYFAVKAGVLEFDGHQWDLIPGAGAIYDLSYSGTGDVFWAGAKGFGKIITSPIGRRSLQYLSDSSAQNIFQTLSVGGLTYFLTQDKIYLYRGGRTSAELVVTASERASFTGMFELYGVVYVQTERNATFKVQDNELVYVNLNFTGHVVFHVRRDDAYIVATSDNRLHRITPDLDVKQLHVADQPYADANVIVAGAWINDELLALGTLRGGVMLVNPKTGERDQVIDYSTGLPDNEVFALMADANQNLWIAHDYGFTKAAPALPFRSFSYYEGLQGNLLCAYSFNEEVYVGTSLGLYKLGKLEVYDEVISYIDAPPDPDPTSDQPQEEVTSPRRNLLGFLRRRKADDAETEQAPSVVEEKRRQKQIDRVLRSVNHVFQKVEGINAKITHLVNANGKLIAGGLEGVFEVEGTRAKVIMPGPTRHLQASADQAVLMVVTYRDELWMLTHENRWQRKSLLSSLGDQVDFMFEGDLNEWWLCGFDRIHRIELKGQAVSRRDNFYMPNANFERTVGMYLNDSPLLVNTSGFFRYSTESGKLYKIDTLPRPSQYFAVNGGILYKDEHRWNKIGESDEDGRLQLLNLFRNLRYVTTDENPSNFWVISGNNNLLRFSDTGRPVVQSRFPIFLRSVYHNTAPIADFSSIKIEQSSSVITFEVVQPDFINPQGIAFRYFLEGMHQDWSEWSSANSKITFPYLPPGQYRLRAQARNIFGRTTELSPVPFQVVPPYWKQPWFYAMEFMVFASLVMLSFRLSTRYRIISRFLSLVTIILLIEFIQTAIGASIVNDDSPVVEFLIQFAVAILIFPVESFLRNLMLRSLETSNGSFYRLLTGEEPRKIAATKRKKSARRSPVRKST